VLEEIAGERDPVGGAGLSFRVLPKLIKAARPDARVADFSGTFRGPIPEAFGICPWQAELLDGLLGADLVGFHVQAHCNNFLDTVDRLLESRIDRERFAGEPRWTFHLRAPFPISVPFRRGGGQASASRIGYLERTEMLRAAGVEAPMMGVGVDRIDYTKGIPERLRALETFFEEACELRGTVHLCSDRRGPPTTSGRYPT